MAILIFYSVSISWLCVSANFILYYIALTKHPYLQKKSYYFYPIYDTSR